MILRDIFEKYSEEYVVLMPMMRDAMTNKPLSFKVLEVCALEHEAVAKREYYEGKGNTGVFIFPVFVDSISLEPRETARMFRVLMGGA